MDFRIPTHTFSGFTKFTVGEYTIELHEAHGETHDMLFVYIPELELLLPGDNYYQSFPNLYTIRGSSPRPIRDWIRSLDSMRRLNPKYLVQPLLRYRPQVPYVSPKGPNFHVKIFVIS